MLDGEGYPKAFIETAQFKVEFSRASLKQFETHLVFTHKEIAVEERKL